MNRRKAVAALIGLQAVERIVKIGDLKPSEPAAVHVTVDVEALSRQVADRLVRDIRQNRIGTLELRAAFGLPVPGGSG